MGTGQAVHFTGPRSVLELDNLAGFQAVISAFSTQGDRIDLGGFTYSVGESVAWSQSATSGTLTVTDGSKTANLTLLGTYATSEFKLSNDEHGGTAVSDPAVRPASPSAARLIEALAGFHGGRFAASFAEVHSSGTGLLSATPLVPATTSGQ
jgi:hypothetical protein